VLSANVEKILLLINPWLLGRQVQAVSDLNKCKVKNVLIHVIIKITNMNTSRKLRFVLLSGIVVAFLQACGPGGEKTASSDAKTEKDAVGSVYKADTGSSVISWEGSKPGGSHNGTIMLSEGNLMVDNGTVTGGEFVINMKSIKDIDLTDPEYNAKLVGHLMSSDFFAVDSFPTARFKITQIEKLENQAAGEDGLVFTHAVTGNLTIKDMTRSITFNAAIAMSDGVITASTGKFVIDRSEWNIKYGSRKFFDNLKDKFINDEIGLQINLKAVR